MAQDRIDSLLRKGYFPAQIPPCFGTGIFADKYKNILAEFVKIQPPPKSRDDYSRHSVTTKLENYSVARVGYKRRLISIPNPISHLYTAKTIVDNWIGISKIYRKSKLSLSRPRFKKISARATYLKSMSRLYEEKVRRSAGHSYVLKTDISRFFPTIYTHSIPWAAHSKALAKRNRKIDGAFYGNLIDLCARQSQDGQTIGIPIGPDTSHIISEIIGVSIDLEIYKKNNKKWPVGFRYVDDIYLFFDSLDEAKKIQACISQIVKEYELQINFEKTEIKEVIDISDDLWPHEISRFEFSKNKRKQRSDICHFFELSKKLAKKYTDEGVFSYALKRVSGEVIYPENWGIFESYLCQVGMYYTNTLQIISRIIGTYFFYEYPLNKLKLSRFANSIINKNAPFENESEVAWALWIIKENDLDINKSAAEAVQQMTNSICNIILIDLLSNNKSLLVKNYKIYENKDELVGVNWLLSYELGFKKWVGFDGEHIEQHEWMKILKDEGVSFYDQNAKTKPIFTLKNSEERLIDILDERVNWFEDVDFDDEDDGGYESFADASGYEDEEDDEDLSEIFKPERKANIERFALIPPVAQPLIPVPLANHQDDDSPF